MNYREFLILFDRPGSDLWRDHGSPTIWILAANFLTDDLFDRGGFADYTESDWKDHVLHGLEPMLGNTAGGFRDWRGDIEEMNDAEFEAHVRKRVDAWFENHVPLNRG